MNCIRNAPNASSAVVGANAHNGTMTIPPSKRDHHRAAAADSGLTHSPITRLPTIAPIIEMPVNKETLRRPEVPLAYEEGRVHVLRAMGDEVHHRHEQRQVQEELPVRCDGAAQSAPGFFAGLFPDFGLLDAKAHEKGQQRRQSTQEEERPPAEALEQEEVGDRRQQIASGVTLLQQSGQHAAQPRRNFLHGERRADAPLAAHADAEQRAQDHEGGVVGREPGSHLADGKKHQVDHQWKAAAVAVGEQSEKEGAHRPEGERRGDGKRDRRIGLVKLSSDGGEAERDQKEIESVQRPAEESGSQRGPVIGRRRMGIGSGYVQ